MPDSKLWNVLDTAQSEKVSDATTTKPKTLLEMLKEYAPDAPSAEEKAAEERKKKKAKLEGISHKAPITVPVLTVEL